MSNVEATHSFDAATAEKTGVYEQVDEVAEASTNYYNALTTAIDKETTDRDAARVTWWAAEANAPADLRIASATADRDSSVAILGADKTCITLENNAQKTLRETQSTACQTSETPWAQHDKTFYLAEVDKSATLSSGLSDPWSVRDDNLRAGRAPSDRNRLAASLMLTTAKITNQKNLELVQNTAETIFRNNSVLSVLTANTNIADASLTSVTTTANAHRTAGSAGSLPDATPVIHRAPAPSASPAKSAPQCPPPPGSRSPTNSVPAWMIGLAICIATTSSTDSISAARS